MTNKRGFSLPEVALSMLILMVGVLMVAHSMAAVLEANYRANQETRVAGYAQEKIENLKTLPFTHPDLGSGVHTDYPEAGVTRTWSVVLDATGTRKTISLTVERSLLHGAPLALAVAYERAQ